MEDSNNVNNSMLIVVKEWYFYFISKWKLISLFLVIGVSVGLTVSFFYKKAYEVPLLFVLSSEDGKTGGISSLASQFGLDLGGGGNSAFAGENIITLMRSKKIIKKALFNELPNRKFLLINYYIKSLGIDEKLKKDPYNLDLYPMPNDINKLSPRQDSLVSDICEKIDEQLNTVIRLDKKQNFYSVLTKSKDEIIATFLPKFIVSETAQLYSLTKTSSARKNLEMLQKEADSLRQILDYSVLRTSENTDKIFNLNSAIQVQKSSVQQGQLKTAALSTAYGEVLKNLVIAKINLQKETPLFQIIDQPQIPLKRIKIGKLKGIVFGGAFFFMVIIFYLSLLKYFRD